MSGTNEKIIFTIEVDEGQTEKRIITLRANIAQLTKEKKELEAANKAGTLSAQEYANAVVGVEKALKANQAELRDQTRMLDMSQKATQAATNSLAQLGQKAANSSKAVGEIGDSFGLFGGHLEALKGGLEKTRTGLEAAKLGLTGLKGAIAATGIGLLVIAIGALYAWLTKTQAGLDFVERKTAAVGKVFQLLLDKITPVGKAIFDAFNNPKQALTSLANLIKDQVINRFKALYEIGAAVANLNFGRLVDGFLQFGTGVEGATGKLQRFAKEAKDAAAAGEKIATANQQIRKEESDLNVQRAKSRAEVERLKKLSEDTTKSTKEREAAARSAYGIEQGLLGKQLALQQRKIDLLKAERAESKRTDEEKAAINEAQAQYYELQEESLGKQTELQNSLNSIRQEGVDRAKQQTEEAKKAAQEQLQIQQQIASKRLEIAKLRGQDTFELELDLIRKTSAAEAAQVEKSAELRELIAFETEAKIQRMRVEKAAQTAAMETATRQAGLQALLALAQEGSSTELKLRLDLIRANAEAERVELERTADNTVEGRKLLAAKLAQVDAEARAETERVEREFADRQAQRTQQAAEKEAELRQKIAGRIRTDQAKSLADQQTHIEAQLTGIEAGSKEEFALRQQLVRNRMQEELLAENLTQDQRKDIIDKAEREIELIGKEYVRRRIESIATMVEGVNGIYSKLVEAQIATQTKALEREQSAALNNASLSADQRTAIEKKYQREKEKLERDAAIKRKRIASVENIINTARAVTAALATGLDPITKAIGVAIAVATGAAQQAVIESQQFAQGGYVSDQRGGFVTGPGSGTSDSIPARLSNGEAVVNAKSTQQFYPLLSWLNQLGGGKAYPGTAQIAATAMPSLVTGYAGGGVASGGAEIDYDLLAAKIAERVGPAVADANRYLPPPVVSVQEVTSVSNRVQAREQAHDH